jgi:hypothetical protein
MKSALPHVAVVLGVVLLVCSAAWSSLFPPTRTWTQEKSERLSKLGSEANRLKFAIVESRANPSMHAGRNPAEVKKEYDQVMEEYDALNEELKAARDAPQAAASVLRWAGILLTVVGAIAVFMRREGA